MQKKRTVGRPPDDGVSKGTAIPVRLSPDMQADVEAIWLTENKANGVSKSQVVRNLIAVGIKTWKRGRSP